jgi:archaellum component FlaC
MRNRDFFWVLAAAALGGLAAALVMSSVSGRERSLPLLIIAFQMTATIFWIWRSHVVESQQYGMLRRPLLAEQLRAATDVIESTQAAASNSLIATGIILSAIVLVSNAARFADPNSNASELLAVAPKAFTATGFGLVCGLLLMVRAHFGALQVLGLVRPTPRADDRPSTPASTGDAVHALTSVANDLGTIVAALASEQRERQTSATELRKAVQEVATLVTETRNQLPKSALGRLASSTEQFSRDVETVCEAILGLKSVLEVQAESIRETTVKELHDALTQQAAASFEAFQGKLVPGFAQKMDQVAGHIEQRIEHIAEAARESVEGWRPELESTLNRLSSTIERKSEDAFREVRDAADRYLERRIDVVLNDARIAEQNLEGIVEHLRGMNQSLGFLLSGLAETETTLRKFAPNGSRTEAGPEVLSFLQQMSQLAETVDKVALRFLYEFEALEAKKEKVRALRTQISEALADSSN